MAKARATVKYGDPVYTWAFRSSQPRGGQTINYETRLEENGDLRCNCPGWVFCRVTKDASGKPLTKKACTHTHRVEEEAPDILARWKRGEALDVLEDVGEATARASKTTTADPTKIRFGRLIEL